MRKTKVGNNLLRAMTEQLYAESVLFLGKMFHVTNLSNFLQLRNKTK